MASTGTLRIEPFDLAAMPATQQREYAALLQALDRERTPEDPPTPAEVLVERFGHIPPFMELRRWVARDGERIVGQASLVRYRTEENAHVRELGVNVHPETRRRGTARSLLAEAVSAVDDPEANVVTATNDRVPAGAAFARRFGLEPASETHTNQLDLSRVDRAMLRGWIGARPSEYEIVAIEGDVPDALMPKVLVVFDVMNTAPRDGLRIEDFRTTPEFVNGFIRQLRATGRATRLLLAVETRTGDAAGFTQVSYDPRISHVVQQHGTAVVPAHRGHGIGKWLKAAALERVFADWPRARYVRTGNADSNAPMLAINHALGFRPAWAVTLWQGPIASVRASLAR